MKKYIIIILAAMLCILAISCGKDFVSVEPESIEKETDKTIEDNRIVVGFSQLGAESDWRTANTESMKSTFTQENGYELIFEDGQQKQANQITAIRTFIQQEVDYIVLAPVSETGWDTVLQEAKDAGIPVIIVDRMVNVADDSLFTCCIGSNFELEAKKATKWLENFVSAKGINPENVRIVNIQGTLGGSAQIGRTKGLVDAVKENKWTLLAQETGDFTQAKGQEVMEAFLKQFDDINIVYCENDNEALGAIDAIEAAGKKVGSDIENGEIMILSFDGVKKGVMDYVLDGRISCIAECNPLHGPRVRAIIEALEKGESPDKFSYVDEEIFCADSTISQIIVDEKTYDVTILTKELVESRFR